MDKLLNFEEVKNALKEHLTITSNGKDVFYLKNETVVRKFDGNMYRLKLEEFESLYKDVTFYYPDIIQESVDLSKDEEYYGRIQKHN